MTKEELVAECKAQNAEMFQVINDKQIKLVGQDYENACEKWAEMRLEQITVEEARAAAEAKRVATLAKLAALGLTADDLKALGLGGN